MSIFSGLVQIPVNYYNGTENFYGNSFCTTNSSIYTITAKVGTLTSNKVQIKAIPQIMSDKFVKITSGAISGTVLTKNGNLIPENTSVLLTSDTKTLIGKTDSKGNWSILVTNNEIGVYEISVANENSIYVVSTNKRYVITQYESNQGVDLTYIGVPTIKVNETNISAKSKILNIDASCNFSDGKLNGYVTIIKEGESKPKFTIDLISNYFPSVMTTTTFNAGDEGTYMYSFYKRTTSGSILAYSGILQFIKNVGNLSKPYSFINTDMYGTRETNDIGSSLDGGNKEIPVRAGVTYSSITLIPNKTTIRADGADFAYFKVLVKDENNNVLPDMANYFEGNKILVGNVFTTTTAGTYNITAKIAGITSNTVVITVK